MISLGFMLLSRLANLEKQRMVRTAPPRVLCRTAGALAFLTLLLWLDAAQAQPIYRPTIPPIPRPTIPPIQMPPIPNPTTDPFGPGNPGGFGRLPGDPFANDVWECSHCKRQLGTGPFPPHYDRCPYCG